MAFRGLLSDPAVPAVLGGVRCAPEATEKPGEGIGEGGNATVAVPERQGDVSVLLKPLWGPNLTQDFIDTLSALSPVNLSVHQLGDIHRRRLHKGIKTFVGCVMDGGRERVVATATLILENRFAHGGSVAGHVEDVAVHPDWQRRGIGRKLVQFVLQQAWELRCRKVTLNCAPHLEEFYGVLGFVKNDLFLRVNNPRL